MVNSSALLLWHPCGEFDVIVYTTVPGVVPVNFNFCLITVSFVSAVAPVTLVCNTCHVYVVPITLLDNGTIKESPSQIVGNLISGITLGNGFTVNLSKDDKGAFKHPFALVAVTS